MPFDLVLLTEKRYIHPQETDWYTEQVLLEDQLVIDHLSKIGLNVTKKAWCDPDFDWSSTKTILFRSVWDYFHRFSEFSAWLDRVSDLTELINPADQIRWNMDKHYLNDLKANGIPVVESHFIPKGSTTSLAELHTTLGWNDTVLKPTVSGAGRHTYRLHKGNYAEHEQVFSELIAQEDFMLQPFQKNIVIHGEVSHVLFDGKHSHSVHKFAKTGDYRVQDDFGGSHFLYAPSPEEIAFAEKTVATCNPVPIYARVDVVWNNDNELAIGELELIEPELWFRKKESAAELLAIAIKARFF